ncbi:RAB6A-GEF complex partner protein 2-like [Lineus longissimus]|uniref:RAB6A-GEF complex partner protein 2-like n=1 Tax=Lineus longissimus TaxID=88925 RepID=UPI002B4E3A8A
MLEVTANLVRGSVYLAGEEIECEITVYNTLNPSRSPRVERLAWASAQILCQCSVSESRIVLPVNDGSEPDQSGLPSSTSFVPARGERGLTVLSSKPKILFCDLRLKPGEARLFTYREKIPSDAPPSYKGQAVKYSYKLTIGTQRLESHTQLMRISFRVLVLYGLNDLSVYAEPEEVAPSNPFLEPRRRETTLLDVAMQVLSTATSRKGPSYYNITNALGKVARLCLFKQAYKIGEDIVGLFDFTDAEIPCVQFSVILQSEEQISDECKQKTSKAQSSSVVSHTKHHEFCLHTQKTHMSLPIPLTATPSFITDIVCLRWRLHFEFVTSKNLIPDQAPPSEPTESCTWQGPETLEVETMVWDMPIKVFATNPVHASSVSLLKTTNVICI